MGFVQKRLGPRLWSVYALAIGGLWLAQPSPSTLVVGGMAIALGEGLRLWATGHLHKNDALTTTGPYAYLRHPLYLGTLLIAIGFSIMAAHPAAWAALGAFALGYFGYYMPYKNRIEGARLEALYGDLYRRYAVAVPRLIPRLHPYAPLAADRPTEAAWRGERFRDNHEIGTAAAVALAVSAMIGRWGMGP